jgi:(1->4)-alpha-D-glucan 1-alpha-D-glucosylmutase
MTMRRPLATYRLQLHAGFGFDAAAGLADYLKLLGVSHVYSSPYLQAMPGSKHGYDVADEHSVNLELGGPEAHERFCLRLGECGLGQVLDIVPNHMAIGGRWNRWWWDVLENGLASPYASYFDIDWQSPEERLRNKVLLPILGDHYGRILERNEIRIVRNGSEFIARYHEHELPLAPETIAPLLLAAAEKAHSDSLGFLADSLDRLSTIDVSKRATLVARSRDLMVVRRWLDRLFTEQSNVAAAVDEAIAAINASADALDDLLNRQNYRVAYWKAASRDLGYRRFFDINTLVGLRMEDEQVFCDTHSLIIQWLRKGVLDGVRVDHPDGLRNPQEYFCRLRREAPDVWIVGEKILEPGEELPDDWPVEGTTGYDFLNVTSQLLVDSQSEIPLTDFYREFTGIENSFDDVAFEKKIVVLRDILGSDVNRLAAIFQEIGERHRDQRDYTRHDIRHAISTLVASFPVYRSYVRARVGHVTPADIEHVSKAVETARRRRPDIEGQLFDFLRDVLLLRVDGELETDFVMRFQQFTPPATAKGMEDTAFYTWNRLISLNEVGGDPGAFGMDVDSFHRYCLERHKRWPHTQLAGSTHDTKRSEDVRARIALLSEIPDEWPMAVRRWSHHNQRHRTYDMPDANTEYFLYQTMFGAWPISFERLRDYMLKVVREGKEQSSWTHQNKNFEDALEDFIRQACGDSEFMADFEKFTSRLVAAGRVNSLAQTLLRMVGPGVPDIYQGTELWDLSLVDPDNRRPVDYQRRRELIQELDSLAPAAIMERSDDGLPKLWTIRESLRLRRGKANCFGPDGRYTPLRAEGSRSDCFVAFQRGEEVIAAVPRLPIRIAREGWADTRLRLPEGAWNNILASGESLSGEILAADLFAIFPVALLVRNGVVV